MEHAEGGRSSGTRGAAVAASIPAKRLAADGKPMMAHSAVKDGVSTGGVETANTKLAFHWEMPWCARLGRDPLDRKSGILNNDGR